MNTAARLPPPEVAADTARMGTPPAQARASDGAKVTHGTVQNVRRAGVLRV